MNDTPQQLTVVLIPNPGSRVLTVVCPQVPGAISQGETEQEVLANIREALASVIKARLEDGEPAFEPDESLIQRAEDQGYETIREIIADELMETLALDEETANQMYPMLLDFVRTYKNLNLDHLLQVQRRHVEVSF